MEHAEVVQQFASVFTVALSGQIALDSFDKIYSDTNAAIVNQFGDICISMLIKGGIGDMTRIDREGCGNTARIIREFNGINAATMHN